VKIDSRSSPPPDGELRRDRLIDMLTSTTKQHVVIEAPAGHGKTVLAEQWRDIRSTGGNTVGWLQLSGTTVLPNLHAAIGRAQPNLSANDIRQMTEGQSWSGRALTLFLDGYDRVTDDPLRDTIDALLTRESRQLTIVVTSRSPVRATSTEILRIGVDALRFTVDEAEGLLCRIHGLPLRAQEVVGLTAATGGWASALQLVAVALSGTTDSKPGPTTRVLPRAAERAAKSISRIKGGEAAIADYLVGNVLDAIEPRMANFLVRAALSGEPSTLDEPGRQMLAEAQRRHLFVRKIGDGPQTETFPPLIADSLRRRQRGTSRSV
jgi:ATP/maltotriose-dependent transcriptional regulator MalT